MQEWIVHDVSADVRIVSARAMPPLAPALEAEVARLWEAVCRDRPNIFNGRIFTADSITPELISGHWTEFRRSMAQIERPELFADLQVRSLAVNGVIRCADGVLIGRRSRRAVYQAGRWQLPPAGSVDGSAERPDGAVDVEGALLDELQEELGLPPDCIERMVPLCLVEHPGTGVTDLGMEMRTSVDAATLLGTHAASGNSEYEDMCVLPIARILALGDDMMPTVPVFLNRLLALDAARGGV
jgi:8-oxo-dGTP pyrophosphatase MutT (NUDIX family)